ncbi:hypothetical protein T07_8265 [Trichinella nelsoni]|uniref:Uncharacterized protein n=1 Tax=Trichinella nelsoni TaxID=6336 RepID=A0A0V0SFB2_9BILA|nr:hypothetical protein T07_8265 [Trichinella nelsoni]
MKPCRKRVLIGLNNRSSGSSDYPASERQFREFSALKIVPHPGRIDQVVFNSYYIDVRIEYQRLSLPLILIKSVFFVLVIPVFTHSISTVSRNHTSSVFTRTPWFKQEVHDRLRLRNFLRKQQIQTNYITVRIRDNQYSCCYHCSQHSRPDGQGPSAGSNRYNLATGRIKVRRDKDGPTKDRDQW